MLGRRRMAKPEEKREARRLRRRTGMPVRQIAVRLGVSQSSVSVWVRDIEITPAQLTRNWRQAGAIRGAEWAETNRERRRAYQREGRKRAAGGERLHEAGCMLYWAEGGKDRNVMTFCNSDVNMVRFMRHFLTECFGVEPEQFILRLNVYTNNGLTVTEIEDHWLRALGLPRSCLRGHSLDHYPTSSSGNKRSKLPYGVCSLRVRRGTGIVQHIFGAIQEYGGFEEPTWLDGPKRRPRPRGPQRERAHNVGERPR
jgi:transposase-like protein